MFNLTWKSKLKTFAIEYGCYTSMFLVSLIFGTWIQTLIFLFMFHFANEGSDTFPILYHEDITKKCLKVTIATFILCAFIFKLMPLNISISCGAITALVYNYIRYKLGLSKNERKMLKERLSKYEPDITPFDCNLLQNNAEDINKLYERIKIVYKPREVEYKFATAKQHFILKLPHNVIDKVNKKRSIRERERMRKKLNT